MGHHGNGVPKCGWHVTVTVSQIHKSSHPFSCQPDLADNNDLLRHFILTSQVPPGGLGGPKCAECQSVPCNGRRNACHRLPTEVHLLVTEDQPSVATDNVGNLLSSARYGRRVIKSLLGLPTKTKQTTGKKNH